MSAPRPVLLLDLGGVLADLGDPVAAMGLDMTLPEFWATWTSSPTVRALETGQMNEEEFLQEIPAVLGCSREEAFGPRFHAWQLKLFPGIGDLVQNAAQRYRVALLSNTNAIHWRQVTMASRVFESFDHVFLSYETGHYKPEHAAFMDVTEFFDCAPGDVLFVDDSAPNIAAARDFGIDAHEVAGAAELRRLLGEADST
ncbi:MAG: HAD-IA family hydrolase [Gammaproteobacteria bacterium]|nr:HAD-IA family hydrolase [Gammaproteobacteria bacterium]MDH3810841.1 HAD-IA family hydrolase [Gammaproteobacteria bacterium]